MDGECSMHGRDEKYRIFVRKPEGKRQLERPRHRWEYNIRMDGKVWTGCIWLRIETSGAVL
jgi:hypothetical protein